MSDNETLMKDPKRYEWSKGEAKYEEPEPTLLELWEEHHPEVNDGKQA